MPQVDPFVEALLVGGPCDGLSLKATPSHWIRIPDFDRFGEFEHVYGRTAPNRFEYWKVRRCCDPLPPVH
jgi:hypothetical protein